MAKVAIILFEVETPDRDIHLAQEVVEQRGFPRSRLTDRQQVLRKIRFVDPRWVTRRTCAESKLPWYEWLGQVTGSKRVGTALCNSRRESLVTHLVKSLGGQHVEQSEASDLWVREFVGIEHSEEGGSIGGIHVAAHGFTTGTEASNMRGDTPFRLGQIRPSLVGHGVDGLLLTPEQLLTVSGFSQPRVSAVFSSGASAPFT